MAYNKFLAERIEQDLRRKQVVYEARKMFGGLCFMVDDKMCVGVVKDNVMVRANPEDEHLLEKPGAIPMDFTGKRMKGFMFIAEDGWDRDQDLSDWVDICLNFNPMAKRSKKK